MSKKSARPARSAKENRRKIIHLTTTSTEGGMCDNDMKLSVFVFKMMLINVYFLLYVRVQENLKVILIFVQLFVIYLDPLTSF